ncbi:MAG TPA: GTP 3',8-cyclase MoaA [Vicinamibacterales bacterium]|nr:GTP 3',8-cyclase MoaA [Vicinamibacterales bacterium]
MHPSPAGGGFLPDALGRPLRSLRLSVTDRCNLRCQYCMPEEDYVWLPRESILTFEEMAQIADAFVESGVDRVRITGGEPLLRRNLPALIEPLASERRLEDLALTTNGLLLASQASALRRAGLHRLTVSLDTLRRDRFMQIARADGLPAVLAGIDAAIAAGFPPPKLDTVVIRGFNDDELVPLLEFARGLGSEIRFIEYMDVGGATHWSMGQVVPGREILERLGHHFGAVEPVEESSSAPAVRYTLPDGTAFGIIASTTEPFCRTCDRSRITADGVWLLCLYALSGTDLRGPLRAGATRDDLRELIETVWKWRIDRGAEERLASKRREVLIPVAALRRNAHLEMHTRGG